MFCVRFMRWHSSYKNRFIKMSVQTTIVSAIIIASCSANIISTMSYTNLPFLFLWGIMAIISTISYCTIVHKTIRMDI